MTFEWDDAKNRRNIRKHGYSFEDAPQAFEGVYLELEDTRYDPLQLWRTPLLAGG